MIYHDIYIEQAVSQKPRKINTIYILLCCCVIAWSLFLEFITFNMAYSVVVLAGIFMIWFLNHNRSTDFDYTYTNGTLEIDKITGKDRRKTLFSIDIEHLIVLAPSGSAPVQPYVGKRMKTYDCTSHDPEVPYYTMIMKNPAADEEIKVLFEPNQELLNELRRKGGTKVTVAS